MGGQSHVAVFARDAAGDIKIWLSDGRLPHYCSHLIYQYSFSTMGTHIETMETIGLAEEMVQKHMAACVLYRLTKIADRCGDTIRPMIGHMVFTCSTGG